MELQTNPSQLIQEYSCGHCKIKLSSITDLKSHLFDSHSKSVGRKNNQKGRLRKCETCNKELLSSYLLKLHILSVHEGKKAFKCDLCQKDFTSLTHLNTHKKCLHMDEDVVRCFECETCKKKFKTNGNLTLHREIHQSIKYGCKQCELSFSTKSGLRRHVQTEHLKQVYKCEVCYIPLRDKEYLKKHMKTLHSETVRETIKCELCNKNLLTDKIGLEKHIKLVHDGEGRRKCNICNKSFFDSVGVRRHQKTVHRLGAIKSFKCLLCNETFPHKDYLKSHNRRHQKKVNKEFECDVCSKKFISQKLVNLHKRTHRTRFSCDRCQSKFTLKGNLSRHVKNIHLKEKRSTSTKINY